MDKGILGLEEDANRSPTVNIFSNSQDPNSRRKWSNKLPTSFFFYGNCRSN